MLAELFRQSARDCAGASPLTSTLLAAASADLDSGGPTKRVMANAEWARAGDVPALRFAAAVHRVVLEGRAPALAAHYPTVGGSPELGALWADARGVVEEHADELRALVDTTTVQTNEPGRSGPLFGGLHTATALAAAAAGRRTPFPVRLLEVGASGGLNLRPHRIAYLHGDRVLGDPSSPLRLDTGWSGEPEGDLDRPLRLVGRGGCDPNPVDVSTVDGRRHLLSFVWPDQRERWARLGAALDLAAVDPVPVRRAPASEWLGEQLARPERDVLTVVWHSIVWQYASAAERAAGRAVLASAAERATAAAPLALLVFESRRGHDPALPYEFQLLLKLWPAGRSLRLGAGGPHGTPFTWKSAPWL
ncbi:DUF2332 domain-containing protein [Actinosynnema mirum]|uniref:DUF2332 domain-containing protein n=1 Tax=Actinosynnema mirum (strain ATCC 29888 / DSM 43827 / JCM 3225 / NBRC 14064 / NCIMB 13271 / NRRL B-12336 / IMRU 3971 / 101) TaxID=446462 RepID=C6WM41_ACTMD|nr:DUF2332 domain-containing protein [Actinosynnema mirum]ACU34775.1 conserved hypothetical protein [Actinosynnema mirum DSM 43827]